MLPQKEVKASQSSTPLPYARSNGLNIVESINAPKPASNQALTEFPAVLNREEYADKLMGESRRPSESLDGQSHRHDAVSYFAELQTCVVALCHTLSNTLSCKLYDVVDVGL